MCNNLVLGISMAAVAEGLSLGQRLGIDAKTLSRIFNTSSARCWSSDVYNPCPVRHTTARFAVGLEALCQQDSWAALLPSGDSGTCLAALHCLSAVSC